MRIAFFLWTLPILFFVPTHWTFEFCRPQSAIESAPTVVSPVSWVFLVLVLECSVLLWVHSWCQTELVAVEMCNMMSLENSFLRSALLIFDLKSSSLHVEFNHVSFVFYFTHFLVFKQFRIRHIWTSSIKSCCGK